MTEQTAQSNAVNTSQPTPLRGLVLRGNKKVETVRVAHEDGTMVINLSDYNEEEHGKILPEPLPSRKKKAKKKAAKKADKDAE